MTKIEKKIKKLEDKFLKEHLKKRAKYRRKIYKLKTTKGDASND